MSRLPPLPRSDLPPAAQQTHDTISSFFASSPLGTAFAYKRPTDDALIGPMPFYLASPDIGQDVMGLVGKAAALPGLSLEARETAILADGGQDYEVGGGAGRLIAGGEKPKDLDEESGVAFDVATYLSSKPGALPQEMWNRSVRVLGREGTVALVHFVGLYAYTCIVLNAMDAPVPQDGK
ncbi:hypothetical protein LTR91_023591 [Friedmanniomyces endolithicus]|uniref:Uncharacterized protein n=1 Tax=Friedmanniomyces endolithicus TaxID=329885 RepID=A0AAN6H1Z1_9PEZI|nr:hypothetical protein LTR38_010980 [Friedmanniomyces endolithicus]KAK0793410.1 hypothetical protein LTR75_011145 [Friedmanniomyces endolithicus]KAK0800090.1 hypothetical protein LTR59_005887 [Friedmanniomyces endolithicus]KAK0842674.1 hypothetical protein LTR03_009154 [Friedmanniomyces endolithicus]KAK0867937.1 hypothetical protein LTS02_003910 [Friedmanniomyces endolithicus]